RQRECVAQLLRLTSCIPEVVFELRPVANLGPAIVPKGRAASGARHFGEHVRLVTGPTFDSGITANVALQHDKHARTDVPVVHAVPTIRLVVPKPGFALGRLEESLDATVTKARNGAAFLRRLE